MTAGCFPAGVHCLAFEWYIPCFWDQGQEGGGLNQLGSTYDGLPDGATMADELIARGVITGESDFDINVIQTDALTFGLDLAGVQCRHNMTNMDPFANA